MEHQEELRTQPIRKLLLKYSVPAIIGMLVNSLYNVVDRIFIGNMKDVGSMAMTGLGITMPIITIVMAFGMLVGIGATTNISLRLGEGHRERAERILGNAASLAIIIGLIIAIIGLIFKDQILYIFGASSQTIYYAREYIGIIFIGVPASLLSFSLNHSIRADGKPIISASIMIVGCLTNVVLDYIFIFRFDFGIRGAALATIISQCLTAILTSYYYISGKSNLTFKFNNMKLDAKIVKTIFAIGMASFFMQLAASLVQVISNHSLRIYGGDLAIGAMTTIVSINMMFLMPIFGINQGSQPIVGFNYGAKQYDRVRRTLIASMSVATTILTIGFLAVQIAPEPILGIFNRDPELMAISVNGIRKITLGLFLIGISIVGGTFIQSIGKAKISMILSLLRQVILLIPLLIFLPKIFGLDGVWFSQPIADVTSTIITIIVVIKELRLQRRMEMKLKSEEN
ncbi:MAG: MATE family efflux transporter [Clostridioides sp.]|nr:MATE family efflux transporter [Clostridioides sp.]